MKVINYRKLRKLKKAWWPNRSIFSGGRLDQKWIRIKLCAALCDKP